MDIEVIENLEKKRQSTRKHVGNIRGDRDKYYTEYCLCEKKLIVAKKELEQIESDLRNAKNPDTMIWEDALKALKKGYSVRRVNWNNEKKERLVKINYVEQGSKKSFSMILQKGKDYGFIFHSPSNVYTKDWVIINHEK